jgi:hypothetical protein
MTSNDKTYNGWTNYETWRIMLELFDGYDPDGTPMTADSAMQWAEDFVDMTFERNSEGVTIIRGWIDSFLQEVNWKEIANAINENHELTTIEEEV